MLSDGARKAAEIAHTAKDAAVSELLDISRAAFFISLSPLVLLAAVWWWNENAGKEDDTLTTLGLLWAVSRFVIL